jgi:hypothetical protein
MPSRPTDRFPGLADRPEVRAIAARLADKPLALRDYHAVGRQLGKLADNPAVACRGSGWRRAVADAVARTAPVSVATLNKCLQFARAYAAAEVATLERVEPRWGVVSRALGVADRARRDALLRQAASEGWSEDRVRDAVMRARPGLSRGGGRERAGPRPAGLRADLGTLLRLTRAWTAFYRAGLGDDPDRYAREAAKLARADPVRLGRRVAQLEEAVGVLLEGAARAAAFARQVRRDNGLPDPAAPRPADGPGE